MLEKLRDVRLRYDEVNRRLQDPATVSDNKLFRDLMREYKNLTPLIEAMDDTSRPKKPAGRRRSCWTKAAWSRTLRKWYSSS